MKRILLWLSILLLSTNLYSTCKTVGVVKGREYNELIKRWYSKNLELYVCNDSKYPYYISSKKLTTARVALTKKEKDDFLKKLEKGMKWTKLAKKDKVASFEKRLYINYNYDSNNYENRLILTFLTANNGKQNDIVFNLIDFDNQFIKEEVYLPSTELQKLISIVKKSEKILEEVKNADEVAKKFN